ncbi:MAG: hypothetical protein E7035_01570 [Verrucomicrobiaceae bacterium]|nr:hypothetical protein [Verrucomicrobiaceae bacterium]
MAKIKMATIKSRAEFEEKIDICAQLDADKNLLAAELDKKILALKEKYGTQIESIKKQTKELTNACSIYAASHPEIFGKNKSAETALARFGFRTGQPTIKTVGRISEARALENLLLHKNGIEYATTKISLNKPAIREGLEKGEDEWLADVFCVVQEETFFVEAKTDEGK